MALLLVFSRSFRSVCPKTVHCLVVDVQESPSGHLNEELMICLSHMVSLKACLHYTQWSFGISYNYYSRIVILYILQYIYHLHRGI